MSMAGRSLQAVPNRRRLRFDRRVLLMTLVAALPATVVALVLLWTGGYTPKVQWTFAILIVLWTVGFAFGLRDRIVMPLQTLSNLLAALREGDFSIRARGAAEDDPLGEVMLEVNALLTPLREQRLGALEATTLLRKVMAEIDVAVFAFDRSQRLQLVNRAGERLLAQPAERILGRRAANLGLGSCLDEHAPRVLDAAFPGATGRWEIRRSTFRQGGLPHRLLVVSDMSQSLREQEREAWQRLIRVLGHELNNSLAPIKSIAGSLRAMAAREPPPDDWREDLDRGLEVIGSRAEALNRFMSAYARLARLPRPQRQPLEVTAFVERVTGLETRRRVALQAGPELRVQADRDQLEQLLINLIRNAVDAALETGGGVSIGWRQTTGVPPHLELWVEDEGPGLSNTANLFVPFFTTKPQGTGIGLVLCRQIAEAHGGSLTLQNRTDGPGCTARLRLPL